MSTKVEPLTARQLLEGLAYLCDQGCWTQHTSARDKHGSSIDSRDPMAVQWCAVGAIIAQMATNDEALIQGNLASRTLRAELGVSNLSVGNDKPSMTAAKMAKAARAAAARLP